MAVSTDLGFGVFCVELSDQKGKYPISGFLLLDRLKCVVETGPSGAHGNLLKALEERGVALTDLDAIIVTHIHLDHSGGAGLLAQKCPNAKIYVHSRGAQHLTDPSKLEASAREVYGPLFETLFAPIVPVDPERLVVMKDGDRLEVGPGRVLEFYDAPGHALHHFFVFDPKSQGIFSGDAAGMLYKDAELAHGASLCLPATTPVQFDPAAMAATARRMKELNPARIYYTHFGHTEKAVEMLDEMLFWLPLYGSVAIEEYKRHRDVEQLAEFLFQRILAEAAARGIPDDSHMNGLRFDCGLNAQGIAARVAYEER
ncbi:MAG: MBL fold metallo-hydrolase [bacterium]|nr:MBL fold metallo-hydrolase [bacterium]